MNRKAKIEQILEFTKNNPEVGDIPVSWWINNPQGVADRLNAFAIKMGFLERFTAEEIGRRFND